MPTKQVTYNPYHQPNPDAIISLTQSNGNDDDGKSKKPIIRRTVDYHTTIINYLETRSFYRTFREYKKIYPTTNAIRHMRPIPFEKNNESHGFCTKYVSTSINKHKCAINCLIWSPEGRRLITGNAMGQFTLWNGLKFNFDTILPAHEYPIRRMIWKYDSEILVSSDSRGYIKYWTSNMKNLINKRGHDESINDMSFSPTYLKFASASADGYVKIWDFSLCKMENNMKEHGWDVTCIDWHPFKSLIISGSKDNLIKLWCPRSGKCIKSLHGHKNTVSCLKINKINGNWLISGSKDQLIKIWDLRMFSDRENKKECLLDTIRPNLDELSCLSWHPFYEKLFVCGGKSGDIKYYKVGSQECQAEIHKAHEQIIWDFAWHPLGHILSSSSNDQTTRFWTRNRPGDDMNDQYNVNQLTGPSKQAALRQLAIATKHNPLGTGRTTKPLTEIGGINLEEIINTEENVEHHQHQQQQQQQQQQHRTHPQQKQLQNNSQIVNHIHPDRLRQIHQLQLPGMPHQIPPPSTQQQQRQHIAPPQTRHVYHTQHQQQPIYHHTQHQAPVVQAPPVHHHQHHAPPPPHHHHHRQQQQQQFPPPPPPPHHHHPQHQHQRQHQTGHPQHMRSIIGQPTHLMMPPSHINNNNNQRSNNRHRERGRERTTRDRSRSRERTTKKGSTVPGLRAIFGK